MLVHYFQRVAPLILAAAAIPAWAHPGVQLGSVSPQYRPTAGSQYPEPVSMQSYDFEVQPETGRARVVIWYTYPNQPTYGLDGGPGPEPTKAQIPGLRYDQATQSVVYEQDGKRTVCAQVREEQTLFWKTLRAEPTGACFVQAEHSVNKVDTGWNILNIPSLDTFFELR
jgi:hypothetical protein